ncbi:unnamed protein product [Caenorhabditis bovis]|uniref:Uncharacterized protein n=1 Tax=Caenorhabditis bovis TaxID=2654633 RepID=A0A8S1E8B9_9PELO|nr:unnamed protein product [Caenorhabditis bovis]
MENLGIDEQIYYDFKNIRPTIEKDHIRSTPVDLYLSFFKTFDVFYKTYHEFNGKLHWSQISSKFLENLEKLNEGNKVIVADRVALTFYFWNCFQYHRFTRIPIKRIYYNRDDCVEIRSTAGIGQQLAHFLKQNREESTPKKRKGVENDENGGQLLIVYNRIVPPNNYKTLFRHDFRTPRSEKYPSMSCQKRLDLKKLADIFIRKKGFLQELIEDSCEFEEDSENDENLLPRYRYYNLEEHFVIGRKCRKRLDSTSSSYSVISNTDTFEQI